MLFNGVWIIDCKRITRQKWPDVTTDLAAPTQFKELLKYRKPKAWDKNNRHVF